MGSRALLAKSGRFEAIASRWPPRTSLSLSGNTQLAHAHFACAQGVERSDQARIRRIGAFRRVAIELLRAARMTRTHSISVVLFASALTIGLAPAVSAQSTPDDTASRAQALSDARDQKVEEVTAPKRSLVERALYWYDSRGLRLGWRAVHFSGGAFPNGAGFGYGIGVTQKAIGSAEADPDQKNRVDGSAFAARSFRGYHRLGARIDVLNVADSGIDLALRLQHYKLPQEDFYGLGSESAESNRSNYRLDGNDIGAGLSWRPAGGIRIGFDASYLTPRVTAGTDSRYATTQSTFTENEVPGLSDLPDFVRNDLWVTYDWRDSDTHPRRGGTYQATVSTFLGAGGDQYDFHRVDVSVQQVVPLPNRYRRIELRAAAALTDAAGDGDVPFIYQPSLGGAHTMRGFVGSRFRDRNAVWATAEYQWEAWWALDTVLFVDAGQVAAHRSGLALNNFDISYGIGFRLDGNERFIARLDLARSREGFLPILGFKYGF